MQELTASQVTEAMIEFVRKNLELDGRKEHGRKYRLSFTGNGVTAETKDISFSLEVIVNIAYSENAVRNDLIKKLKEERKIPRLRKDKVYTAVLFPKSIDYAKAKINNNPVKFECPYFRQARLLKTIKENAELFEKYKEFSHYNIKELSRVEWEVAIPFGGQQVAYYNPLKRIIQAHTFQSFPYYEIIPDNIPLDKGYFWDFAKYGFPNPDDSSHKAKIFRGMQQGLHDRVRKIIRTADIKGAFTLKPHYAEYGARLVSLAGQMEIGF